MLNLAGTVLYTDNPVELGAFYRSSGLEPIDEYSGTRNFFFRTPNGQMLCVMDRAEHEEAHPIKRDAQVFMTTENVDAVYDDFKKRGVPIAQHIRDEAWGARTFVARDADDFLLMVAQWK